MVGLSISTFYFDFLLTMIDVEYPAITVDPLLPARLGQRTHNTKITSYFLPTPAQTSLPVKSQHRGMMSLDDSPAWAQGQWDRATVSSSCAQESSTWGLPAQGKTQEVSHTNQLEFQGLALQAPVEGQVQDSPRRWSWCCGR